MILFLFYLPVVLPFVFAEEFPTGFKQIYVYVGNRTDGIEDYYAEGKLHSQYKQDEQVLKIMRYKTGGTFIDLAANQAVQLSNTFAMERDFDWTGLCVDANYFVWQDLAHRKCTVIGAAVGKFENEEIPFKYRNAGDESAYGGLIKEGMKQAHRTPNEGTVFTTTLNQIFEEFSINHHIDYLSLDIEGAEQYALENFFWHKYKFCVITIEQPSEQLHLKLQHEGYWPITRLGQDYLYVNSDFMSQNEARDLIDDMIQ